MLPCAGMIEDGQDIVYRIGALLGVRQYNRRFLPIQSKATELSPVEFVVLTVHQFHLQIFINGFGGFLFNTDSEFVDFLPIALAAIGATRYSLLARLAWADRTDPEGRFDDQFIELIREEPFDQLLIAYVERHRDELPDPNLATPEFFAQDEANRSRWWGEKS